MALVSAFVVDASCDYPRSFFDQHGVKIIPVVGRYQNNIHLDMGDPKTTNTYYQGDSKLIPEPLAAFGTPETKAVMHYLNRFVCCDSEHMIILTPPESHTKMHYLLRDVCFKQIDDFQIARRRVGINQPIRVKVIDSQCILSGYGLVAYEAIRLTTEKALPLEQLPLALAQFSNRVDTYVALDSFSAFRAVHDSNRLTRLDDLPLSWLQLQRFKLKQQKAILTYSQRKLHHSSTEVSTDVAQETLFSQALVGLKQGKLKPIFNLSFAGTAADIRTHRGINSFINTARKLGAKVNVSMMSQTGMSLCGKGALSISVIRV